MMMQTHFTKQYKFEIAHFIPEDYVDASAATLHGHEFKLAVTLMCEDDSNEMVGVLDHEMQILQKRYAHSVLNEHWQKGTGEVFTASLLNDLQNIKKLSEKIISVQLNETRKNRFQGFTNSCEST